ncbi:MFS general substrate transporter [Epithele typhae]|uniref:MFS general substrate transporter n=1 Tax=Epithele typhae TaxID=378194 RepID=UPI002007E79F|nr:MFS general substrate transporter [Epithele typhae]KAH9941285.1 MFS general substrate transporter [Epithele typhae]
MDDKVAVDSRDSSSKVDVHVVEKSSFKPSLEFTTSNEVYQSLLQYQEESAGRLVLDPVAAPAQFGDITAERLKLSPDKSKILWPQPTDSPNDPQNWSDGRKNLQLFIVTLAATMPDFLSSIGIAAVSFIAKEFHTSPTTVTQLGSSWAIFLIGWGGIVYIMLIRRYGRLPVLFWSQLLSLGTSVGMTFAPNLAVSSVMRDLNALVGTCSQVSGLYVVTDLWPVHLRARKLNLWTMGIVLSPQVAPFLFGFLVARANWRWAFGIGSIYNLVVVVLIVLFMEETMYDRHLPDPLPLSKKGPVRERIETLIGVTGYRLARFRDSWTTIILAPLNVVWRPQLLTILIFEGVLFGFGIGLHVTNTLLLVGHPPNGYGFNQDQISATYASSIGAVVIGEIIARYLNDWLLELAVRRNKGVFAAESRLWTCWVALPFYVAGFVLLGAAFQMHLPVAALVMGWVLAIAAVMVNTATVYAYCNDCFPRHGGEISALLNLARSLGGFSVAYFQIVWVEKHGALQAFGTEGGIVAALFVLVVPFLQRKGRYLRVSSILTRQGDG